MYILNKGNGNKKGNKMNEIITNKAKDSGFETRVYSNAVLVYLINRNTSIMEVGQAFGGLTDLVTMKQSTDPHRYNRTGVLVKW